MFRLRLSCLGKPLHRLFHWVEPPTFPQVLRSLPSATLFGLTTMVVMMTRRSSRFYLSVFSTFDGYFPVFFSAFVSLAVTVIPFEDQFLFPFPSWPLFVCLPHTTFSTGSLFCLFLPFRGVDMTSSRSHDSLFLCCTHSLWWCSIPS